MKTKKLRIVLFSILLIIMLVIPGTPTLADNPPATVDVLVTFYQPPGPAESQLIESLGGSVKTVYHIVPTIAASMPSANLAQLGADPRVKSVEIDATFSLPPDSAPLIPQRPMSPLTGQELPWGVDRIDAELVHPTNNGTGVKIAILDSGIDLDHPDLAVAGNVTFVSGTTNGNDDNGHGTLVAGIAAALDNDIGVVGVAPEASLYAVKVLDQYGTGFMSVILSGIQWARDNNMQVINMSFGSAGNMPSTIKDALDSAYNAGIVIVAGAGDGGNAGGTGNNIWYPARYESAIAVGATDNTDARYTTSSTGYQLEVVAPGVNIYSTAMGGGYGYITGTSASSPHAAGVAALLITANVTNNVDIRHRLMDSAQNLGTAGWDSQFGKGIINANSAITFSEPPDQSAPTTNISLSGTLGNLGWYRSDVEVTLTAQDNPGGSGVAVTKYSLDSGGTWLTYSSPFTITSEGTTLVLARSWDNAGNDEGPPAFKDVKIDKTLPLATTIYLYGTMGSNGWYVSNVYALFEGHDNPGGSGVWTIEYSLNGGQTWQPFPPYPTITTDGIYTVLVRTRDNAGNVESPPASKDFKIDKTAPVTTISLNGTLGNNNWYLSDVTVTLTATDNSSGVATIEYSLNGGGNWLTYSVPFTISTEGTSTVLARARDNAGNLGSPPTSRDVKIDKTAPVTTISLNGTMGNNDWYTSNVTVTLTATDNTSGVATIEYTLNGGGNWLTYSAPFTVSNEGTTTILARARDNAGILEAPPVSRDIKIDKTAPVTTISLNGTMGNNGWYTSNVTVTLTATDNSSGVATIEYSLNGGSNWLTYSVPFTVSNEGTTTILARARDNAGILESPPASRAIKIDRTAPVTTISLNGTMGNNGWYKSNVTVTLTATDNTSGVATIEYSLNGGGSWLTYSAPFIISSEGTTTVLARAQDNAGNLEAPPASRDVKIDKTAPVATETVVPTQISSKPSGTMYNISYNGTASDPVSGLYSVNTTLIDEYGIYSQNLGSALSGTVSVERHCNGNDSNGRTYTFRLTVTDMAGNQRIVNAISRVLHP